jgi:hypothetical protein
VNPKAEHERPVQPGPVEQPKAEKKLFRIEKVEERVAPSKGGNSRAFDSVGHASIY